MNAKGGTRTDTDNWESAIQSVSDWLVDRALGDTDMEAVVGGLCDHLVEAGLPVWRVHVALSTLHPLFKGKAWTWRQNEGIATTAFRRSEPDPERWLKSPQHHMLTQGLRELRRRLEGANAELDFPILEEFKDEGATDYLSLVTPFSESADALERRDGMISSWTTDRQGGFADDHIAAIKRLESRLGVAVKMRAREETAENVVSAYLGSHAGRRVLDGNIKLGDAETIDAVIWYSDLRQSTSMADRLPPEEFLAVLNTYFECAAGAVRDHGGEVLRFVGDAVLAIFPIEGPGGGERAARLAMVASGAAGARLAKVNDARAEDGEEPLVYGLGLHVGEVMYGNIGVPERLEFSVIGPAANEVARLEDLTKELDRPVVVSADFAKLLPLDWETLGRHELRGVGEPRQVFAPPAGD